MPAIVFYDLETGGLDPRADDILELGAVTSSGQEFQVYVRPTKPIDITSSRVNGLTADHNGNLYLHGSRVPAVPLAEAMQRFQAFLKDLRVNKEGSLLVAHWGSHFDDVLLRTAVDRCQMQHTLPNFIYGFTDSVGLFQQLLNRQYVKLADLCQEFLGRKQTHGALSDARALRDLVKRLGVREDAIVESAEQY